VQQKNKADNTSDRASNKVLVTSIDHYSMVVGDTARSVAFYTGILGFTIDDSRPDLGYPGAWLNVGSQQIHLLEVPNPDPVTDRPEHGGRDRHLALQVSDLDKVIKRLEKAGIGYSKSKSGRAALFCRDPDANAIELLEKS
jgi:glyoxylase I family protein